MKFAVCLLVPVLSGVSVLHAETVVVQPQSVDVTVRRAPYVVSSVSSKSEHAWAICKYCGGKTSYERKYRWDVYNHRWIETTDPGDVPETCHHCRSKAKDQAKLDQRERELDAKIQYEETRRRINQKEKELRRLRNANR